MTERVKRETKGEVQKEKDQERYRRDRGTEETEREG